jgi:hypothetical protein
VHLLQVECGDILLPLHACGERVGARGRRRLVRNPVRPACPPPSRRRLLPAWRGEVQGMQSRSRGAFFVRTRAMRHAIPKTDAAPRPSSDQSGCGEPGWSRSGTAHERTDGNKERKQNAETRNSTAALARCGAAPSLTLPRLRGSEWEEAARLPAFHCGSRQGDSWSPRLSVRPRFRRLGRAFGPIRPPQPGGGDLALCSA